MRHAKSDWSGPTGNYERRISDKGIYRTRAVVKALSEDGHQISHAWVSPYLRAKLTLNLVCEQFPDVLIEELKALVSGNVVNRITDKIRENETIPSLVIIGHNPSLSSLASTLCNEDIFMRTSDTCVVLYEDGNFSKLKYYSRFDYSDI